MAPKIRDGDVVVAVSAKWVSWAHTSVAYMAFLGALFVGLHLHYEKIVQNEYYVGHDPVIWVCLTAFDRDIHRNGFPLYLRLLVTDILSVRFFSSSLRLRVVHLTSSPNGDHGLIILAGPRFALVFLWYILTTRPDSTLPRFVAGVGLFRTITCGGWTYVTSTDDHKWHDIFMISYLVATLPWTLGCLAISPDNPVARKWRKRFASLFFGTLIPLIYFFIQHKVHKVAGGRDSKYASV